MTATEAQAYAERWKLVNAAEREEVRTTPVDRKFRQLAALMASVNQLGWSSDLAAGEEEVRERWRQLRKGCHG
jgi:hypothetical protein